MENSHLEVEFSELDFQGGYLLNWACVTDLEVKFTKLDF